MTVSITPGARKATYRILANNKISLKVDLTISKCKTLMTFRNTIRALDNEGLNGAYNQVQQRRNTLLTSGMTDDVTKVQRELKCISTDSEKGRTSLRQPL